MGKPLFGHVMQLTAASTTGSGTPVAQAITAVGNTVIPSALVVKLANNTGGGLTLASTPTIPDARDRQMLILISTGTQNVVLQDQGTLPGSNLRLGAATRTLGTRDNIGLLFESSIGDWVELWFSNVL